MAPDQIRHYRIALGPGVSRLTIQAPIEQPKGERRWLGATLYGLDATATGLPLRDAPRAIVPALALLLLALGFVWSARRGHAIVADPVENLSPVAKREHAREPLQLACERGTLFTACVDGRHPSLLQIGRRL